MDQQTTEPAVTNEGRHDAAPGGSADPGAVERMTMHPEEAFARLGVGRSAGYDALHRGEIPSIRIGRYFRVPIVLFERMLTGEWKPGQ